MSFQDDAGRGDDSPGFDVQARIFTGIGLFITVVSIVYGFISYEWAGTVMLSLTSGLAFLTGAYLGWRKPAHAAVDDAEKGEHADDEPWFPSASIWPFAVGAGAALVANGLLLGTWLLAPSVVILAYAVAGFVLQSRRRA
jgi:hypothetical protein